MDNFAAKDVITESLSQQQNRVREILENVIGSISNSIIAQAETTNKVVARITRMNKQSLKDQVSVVNSVVTPVLQSINSSFDKQRELLTGIPAALGSIDFSVTSAPPESRLSKQAIEGVLARKNPAEIQSLGFSPGKAGKTVNPVVIDPPGTTVLTFNKQYYANYSIPAIVPGSSSFADVITAIGWTICAEPTVTFRWSNAAVPLYLQSAVDKINAIPTLPMAGTASAVIDNVICGQGQQDYIDICDSLNGSEQWLLETNSFGGNPSVIVSPLSLYSLATQQPSSLLFWIGPFDNLALAADYAYNLVKEYDKYLQQACPNGSPIDDIPPIDDIIPPPVDETLPPPDTTQQDNNCCPPNCCPPVGFDEIMAWIWMPQYDEWRDAAFNQIGLPRIDRGTNINQLIEEDNRIPDTVKTPSDYRNEIICLDPIASAALGESCVALGPPLIGR